MIKTIIVEDDPGHSRVLSELLMKLPTSINILSIHTNIESATQAINAHNPDLIFLDIQLGNENGFDLFKNYDRPKFGVIFTTQYNTVHNAVNAIRACALDFLSKPIILHELNGSVQRYLNNKIFVEEQIIALKENIESDIKNVIFIADGRSKIKIEINNIIYCESDNSYTTFFLNEKSIDGQFKHVTTRSIKDWEVTLKNSTVCRIHRDFLVNLRYISKYIPKSNGSYVVLKNTDKISVSKSRKSAFENRYKEYYKNF